jgi:hypothetical protein
MIVSFREYSKIDKTLKNYKKSILKVIDEYINYNDEFRKKHDIIGYLYSSDFDYRNNSIVVTYRFELTNFEIPYKIYFTIAEYNDLKKFMKDPDLYKNTKKYNL